MRLEKENYDQNEQSARKKETRDGEPRTHHLIWPMGYEKKWVTALISIIIALVMENLFHKIGWHWNARHCILTNGGYKDLRLTRTKMLDVTPPFMHRYLPSSTGTTSLRNMAPAWKNTSRTTRKIYLAYAWNFMGRPCKSLLQVNPFVILT